MAPSNGAVQYRTTGPTRSQRNSRRSPCAPNPRKPSCGCPDRNNGHAVAGRIRDVADLRGRTPPRAGQPGGRVTLPRPPALPLPRVVVPRPEKAAQPVTPPTRHDVHVQVRYGLADDVVLGHPGPV